MKWPDGTFITGAFYNDEANGFGEKKWANGQTYSGGWAKGFHHGLGKMQYVGKKDGIDGGTWAGEFLKGKRSGYGVRRDKSGAVQMKGEWENDKAKP